MPVNLGQGKFQWNRTRTVSQIALDNRQFIYTLSPSQLSAMFLRIQPSNVMERPVKEKGSLN